MDCMYFLTFVCTFRCSVYLKGRVLLTGLYRHDRFLENSLWKKYLHFLPRPLYRRKAVIGLRAREFAADATAFHLYIRASVFGFSPTIGLFRGTL